MIAIAKGKAAGLKGNPAPAEKQIGDEKTPSAGQSDPTPLPDGAAVSKRWIRPALVAVALIVAIGIVVAVWYRMKPTGPGVGFVSGNGRVEATEIDVATKLGGRVREILVSEGDFVLAGQVLARMQIDVLDAQRDEARAQSRQAVTAVASAESQVAARQSDTTAARAMVTLRTSDLDAAQRRFARTEKLAAKRAVPLQSLDDDRASVHGAEASVKAAEAQVSAAEAGIEAAQAQLDGAISGVTASVATITRIEADILDSELKSPRDGRVQYRVAQPGEVLPAGGKVMNVVDLSDVYLTFFLPETAVGKVPMGSQVRVILDAASDYVIPAEISYVASVAQFTPKTVETESERQKLMFRVKARFGRELLLKNMNMVKTGLPGVAWLKLDANSAWPEELAIRIPQ